VDWSVLGPQFWFATRFEAGSIGFGMSGEPFFVGQVLCRIWSEL